MGSWKGNTAHLARDRCSGCCSSYWSAVELSLCVVSVLFLVLELRNSDPQDVYFILPSITKQPHCPLVCTIRSRSDRIHLFTVSFQFLFKYLVGYHGALEAIICWLSMLFVFCPVFFSILFFSFFLRKIRLSVTISRCLQCVILTACDKLILYS